MASVFGHGLVGFVLAKLPNKQSKRLLILAIISAILPDIDVVGFYMGIPYEAPLGHRGFTHSIIFALLWAIIVALVFGKKQKTKFLIIIFLATLSHSILDALTDGGRGVGFFIPFDDTRHFFNYRPIVVSPIGIKRFFSAWGLKVILSELVWVGLPCLLIYLGKQIKNHKFVKKN